MVTTKDIKGTYKAEFAIDNIPGNIDVDYDYSLFSADSAEFNYELCRFACKLVTIGYDKIIDDETNSTGFPYTQSGVKNTLEALGFEHIENNPKAERDEVSYFIASRDVTLDDGEYNLIIAAFIGSYKKTWYSNFDPYGVDRVANGGKGYAGFDEKGTIHLGFADARDFVHGKIIDFIKKNASGKKIKLLLMGHSRGAATANLLAAKVIKNGGFGNGIDIDRENIFTYAFATPNFADSKRVDINDGDYDRIFNVVSPEDFVTEVLPTACGYGKYGTIYAIMGRDNAKLNNYNKEKSSMQEFYKVIKKDTLYNPYKNGNRSVEKVTGVMAKSMPDLDAFYENKYRECFNSYTPFEYYKYTLCGYVSGNDTPEDQANVDRAMKLMLGSAFDLIGTSSAYRNISKFFVLKEGIGGATGGKMGATYFSDSHRCETYLAYLLSMSEEELKANTLKYSLL